MIDGKLTLVSVELRNVLQWWKDTVGILSSGTANIAKVKNYPIWSVQIVPKILPKLVFLSSKIGGFSMSKHFQGFSFPVVFILELIDLKLISNSPLNSLFFPSLDYINPLCANPTKWSNTIKQFVDNSWRIVWVCLTILWVWPMKG